MVVKKIEKKEYYFAEHFWSEMHDGKNKVKLSHNPPQENNLKSSMEGSILIIIS